MTTKQRSILGPCFRPQRGGGLPPGLAEAVQAWLVNPPRALATWSFEHEAWLTGVNHYLEVYECFRPHAFYLAKPNLPVELAVRRVEVIAPEAEHCAHADDIRALRDILDRLHAAPPPAIPALLPAAHRDPNDDAPSRPSFPPPSYYESAHWHRVSADTRRAWGFRCVLNAHHRGPVEAHHRDYSHVGNERPEDVVPLCEGCHERFHDRLPNATLFEDERAA